MSNQPSKKEVICPTAMYVHHYQWCLANHAMTTDDSAERESEETYTRVFQDEDQAKWFCFDMGIKA